MAQTDAGGMYFKVSAIVDKNSFEQSQRSVSDLDVSFNKLMGTVRNAGVVLAGLKAMKNLTGIGELESQSYKTATALGTTTEKLDVWRASAKIAGVSADSLLSSMSRLGNVITSLNIDGSGVEEYSKKLGLLRMSFEDIKDLSGDEAFKKIIATAQQRIAGGEDELQVITKVGKILGAEGEDFLIELLRRNLTVDEFLKGASRTQFTNARDNEKAQNFRVEADTLKLELESMSKLFGDTVAGVLATSLSDLNKFIQTHGDDIADWIRVIGEDIGKLVEKLVGVGKAAAPTVKKVGGVLVNSVTGTAEGMIEVGQGMASGDSGKVIEGVKKTVSSAFAPITEGGKALYDINKSHADVQKAITQYIKANNNGKWIEFSRLPTELQSQVNRLGGKQHFTGIQINDGIMRPDGTITKIASDDWVFAARNLSDMARAFIPQNYTAAQGVSEYVINQTFNINGGSDMPQILRQQAYKGTQEGLLEIMNQSSRRLQLMSGTR